MKKIAIILLLMIMATSVVAIDISLDTATAMGITLSTYETTATFTFQNELGELVLFRFAADEDSSVGVAHNEPIYWGEDAPTESVERVDEVTYLEGESCDAPVYIEQCEGATFLVIVEEVPHLVEITEINTRDSLISFEDLTAEEEYNDLRYGTSGELSTFIGSQDIELIIERDGVSFEQTGSYHGATMQTRDGIIIEIINTDLTSQIFEGFMIDARLFSGVYDDVIQDVMVFTY